MGLDLIPEGKPQAGHEAEWRRIIERFFNEEDVSDAEVDRFQEISIPAYETLGAPRVGYDKEANDWLAEVNGAKTEDEVAALIKEHHGYHALALIESAGVPRFSNGGAYDGIDETSFRGSFLNDCESVFGEKILEAAWDHKWPEEAVAYGNLLLKAVDRAEQSCRPEPVKRSFVAKLLWAKTPAADATVEEQIEVVRAAGRWFVFWGERGHPIRAWF